jgi:hypothetical protein
MNKTIEGDTLQEGYDMMKKYAKTLKGVDGISCEIGVRRGMGSKSMMDGFVENSDKRTHVCVDPYGDIVMLNDKFYNGQIRCGFDNKFKMETIVALHEWAFNKNLNLIFLPFEDTEFFKRFSDGVPVYNIEKSIVNKYCYVHVDGPHTYNAAKNAFDFFCTRMDVNSIIAFDNCDHYDHEKLEKEFLYENGFVFLDVYTGSFKKFYKKV